MNASSFSSQSLPRRPTSRRRFIDIGESAAAVTGDFLSSGWFAVHPVAMSDLEHGAIGVVSFSLYLLQNPIQSLAIRLAVRLSLPEAAAALLLVLLPLLAAVLYFRSVKAWSLCLMQSAAQRLQPR